MTIELQIDSRLESVTADMASGEVVWCNGALELDDSVEAPSEADVDAVRSAIFNEISDLNSAIEHMKYAMEQMSMEIAEMQQERKILRRAVDSGI